MKNTGLENTAEMNGYQRVVKTLRFEKTDRAALIPEIIQHNLDIAGENHRNFSSDPEIMCKVILAGLEKYETDAVYVSSDNYLIAEAMGGQVLLPIDEPPRLLKTPAATIEEAVALPLLHITDGRIPVILEARNMSCDYTISLKAFREGRLLFGAWALTEIQSLRNCEQDFGVLPFPKYDEAQENYHCIISTSLTPAVSIPITNPNPSQAGLILEAMTYYSVDTVTHVYYDLSLNSRFIRDEESSEMFDIMFANSVYDFGYIFDVGGLGMILENMFYNKKNTFSSRYASMEKKALAALEDIFSGEH